MKNFNDIQLIKRQMYALRNGVVADTLRKAGLGYKYIFGLTLPQLGEIAAGVGCSQEIAEKLRADVLCRESRLLAPMLYPVERLTVGNACEWIADSDTTEIIDILCHRLLRKMPQAREVIAASADSDRDLTRYAALRLTFNLLSVNLDAARDLAERELRRNCRLTAPMARQMLDEINFLTEDN